MFEEVQKIMDSITLINGVADQASNFSQISLEY